jgi:hypothetical protein
MASTPLLGLALPADGVTNWGTLVNTSITALLDSAVAGTTTITSTSATYTLSTTVDAANEARQAVILCTAATTGVQTIIAPVQSKTYVVINATTNNFGVKIVGVGPTTGVTIPNGRAYMVAWNGSDFVITGITTVNLATDVTGTLAIANGGTGQITQQLAINALVGTQTANRVLRSNGTNSVLAQVALATDVTGTLPIANGGTGQTTQQAAINALVGAQTANRVLRSDGTNSTLAQVALATDVTGTLPVANGGTNLTAYTLNGVLYASGTGTLANGTGLTFDGTKLGLGVPSPFYTLDVAMTSGPFIGSFKNTSTSGNQANIVLWSQGESGSAVGYIGTGGSAFSGAFSDKFVVGTQSAHALGFVTNGSLRALIDSTGTFRVKGAGTAGSTDAVQFSVSAPANSLVLDASGNLSVPGTITSTLSGNATNVTGTVAVANGGTGVTTSTGTGSVVLNNAPTLTAPRFVDQGFIADTAGNRVLNFTTNAASVNYINITPAISGSTPVISAAGAGTNISLQLSAKGTGKVRTNADLLIGGFVSAGNGTGGFSANTIFGESVLSSNVSGEYITAVGTNAAASVTTAQYLTAFGNGAGQTVTTSNKHSAFGYRALFSMNTMADSGDNWNGCTAVGFRALQNNIGLSSVSDSVGVGAGALYSSTTGTLNVALGNGALYSATSGSGNVAVGWKALFLHNNTDAVGIGYNAAAAMVNSPITAVGSGAAEAATAGSVTAIGYRALNVSTNGTDITAVGSQALLNCVAGCNNNTVVGAKAGNNMTFGTSNTYVGASVVASTTSSTSNEIAIGASVTGKGSNTAFIGGTSGAYNGKNVTTWETTSDQRIKRNIVDSPKGLAEINQLRVRNFQYKEEADMPKTEDGTPVVVGLDPNKQVTSFVAQEIQTVFPEAVASHAHGILSVSADPVFYAMVKAIQELTARLEALEAK